MNKKYFVCLINQCYPSCDGYDLSVISIPKNMGFRPSKAINALDLLPTDVVDYVTVEAKTES